MKLSVIGCGYLGAVHAVALTSGRLRFSEKIDPAAWRAAGWTYVGFGRP